MFPRGGGSRGGGAPVDLGIDGVGLATQVGSGGFGVVYRARQEAFDRTVAVKVLSIPSRDDEARKRFARECRSMGALSGHPNIVAVYGSGETSMGHPYILMDFLVGGSLGDLVVREGPFDPAEVAEIGVKLAGALSAAHAAGVLHRDVKPDNVLVSNYAEPQLADFGIARIQGSTETRTGLITGSLAHAAPEVLKGGPATEASDVYSLASTLYALAAGDAPFANKGDENFYPMLSRILEEDPPDLRAHGFPDPLWRVIADGLAKEPSERTPTARAFGEALRDAQDATGQQPTALVAGPDSFAAFPAARLPRRDPARAPDAAPQPAPAPGPGPGFGMPVPEEAEGNTIARPAWRVGDGSPAQRVSLAGRPGLAAFGSPDKVSGEDGSGSSGEEEASAGHRAWAAGDDEGVTYRRERPWSPPPPRPTPPPVPPPVARIERDPVVTGSSSRRDRRDLAAHPLRLAAIASAIVLVVAAVAFAFIASREDPATETVADDTEAPNSSVVGSVPSTTAATPSPSGPPTTRESSGTTVAPAPGTTTGGDGPAVTTAPTDPPGPITETLEVQEPPGHEVGSCWVFRGTANLRANRALVVGVRDQSSPATTYFQKVTDWDGAVGQGGFSRSLLFGADDSSVGHTFSVSFIVVDEAALGGAGAWEAPSAPAGSATLTTTSVTRVPGPGAC
jgi:serine/threonine protein kinase